jgi:hypothetical protein
MSSLALSVYILCALTSIACAGLLFRGYRRSSARLLLWSSLCFAFLALNNIVLIVDVRVLPERDLSIIRTLPSVIGIGLLLYGLVWDVKR